MDMYRAFLAIIISFLILMGYQYFFVAPTVNQQVAPTEGTSQQVKETSPAAKIEEKQTVTAQVQPLQLPEKSGIVDPEARDITIETPLYRAVINEQGGGFKSFVLNDYQRELDGESGLMELVQTELPTELPVIFSLQNGSIQGLPSFKAEKGIIFNRRSLPGDEWF
jgi:YidC/Oxa1 family membrane protein insertase